MHHYKNTSLTCDTKLQSCKNERNGLPDTEPTCLIIWKKVGYFSWAIAMYPLESEEKPDKNQHFSMIANLWDDPRNNLWFQCKLIKIMVYYHPSILEYNLTL